MLYNVIYTIFVVFCVIVSTNNINAATACVQPVFTAVPPCRKKCHIPINLCIGRKFMAHKMSPISHTC